MESECNHNHDRNRTEGVYFGIPLPFWVIGFLAFGLALGYLFPNDPVVNALYLSGTIFPKTIVTLAAFLIFNLLAAATAKLVLMHGDRAGRLFGLIFSIYVAMGAASLLLVAVLMPFLTGIPFILEGASTPGLTAWVAQVAHTFSTVLSQQPLLQALLGAIVVGYVSASRKALRPIANGFILVGDLILKVFKSLLWYYPIMIGCLSIGIPMKFGSKGMALYGQTVLWVAIVTIIWSVAMILLARAVTRRTFKQILSYWATVWPTGFGTGGSYDTLAVNIISAERDLGLPKKVAEVSIVFGTVLNKNCSTIGVLLVTVSVAMLLGIPISEMEVLMLIPPVMILGLESPGVPGGAGFFMSPIIGALLGAPDLNLFVTTFVTVYSGLIPMFAAAGNTTSDGIVGAFLNDLFGKQFRLQSAEKGVSRVA
ncbi:MAG: cation:dicarboxylate symporter family transporter [Chloroflexota bacterium]|jgi:Na+/H+-dicarboxylate symporter